MVGWHQMCKSDCRSSQASGETEHFIVNRGWGSLIFLGGSMSYQQEALMNGKKDVILSGKNVSKSDFLPRVVWPTMIGFVSVSLFLFLSYMIIEGYSIVQMIKTDREVTIGRGLEDPP